MTLSKHLLVPVQPISHLDPALEYAPIILNDGNSQ